MGVLGTFATDFAAGTVGSALEQGISRGRVDLGESLLSGAGNAISEVLYGTGPIDDLRDAFIREARTGAVMSGFENITDSVGPYGVAGSRLLGKTPNEAIIPEAINAGRDPKGMCDTADPFDMSSGLGNGRGYRSGAGHDGRAGGFSLGGFVRDVLTGAVVGGLGSAGFYGAGKAVDALWGSVAGYRNGNNVMNPRDVHFMQNSIKNQTGEYTVLGNVEALKNGTLHASDLPEIRIWKDSYGKIWTLDHRRLAAFRLAELDSVPFRWATDEEIASQIWKMTTKTNGTSIKLKLGNGESIIIK